MPENNDDLMLLIAAAHASGDIARKFWQKSPQAWDKDAGAGPVTEADRAAERGIRETLRAAYPEVAILGEEYGGEEAREGLCWVVDPIDGTIAFARGIPLFSTLISLLEDGEPAGLCNPGEGSRPP